MRKLPLSKDRGFLREDDVKKTPSESGLVYIEPAQGV